MTMNKYELALVINAKIEDDARTDAIEKIKALIEKFGGEITNVDEWGKKKLAYEIQKMHEVRKRSNGSKKACRKEFSRIYQPGCLICLICLMVKMNKKRAISEEILYSKILK